MEILKNTSFIELLNRNVTTYILLPEGYRNKKSRYPVVYMHDGQNLFFESERFSKQIWDLKHAINKNPPIKDCIIVGISSAKNNQRLNEFLPFPLEMESYHQYGGKADLYLEYINRTLKPYIDQTFRTKKQETYMIGSSLGGVVSVYAAIKYPKTFKGVASLSGAFFASLNQLKAYIVASKSKPLNHIYMDCGDHETFKATKETYLKTNLEIYETIKNTIDIKSIEYNIIPGGKHQEADWKKRFSDVLNRLLSKE